MRSLTGLAALSALAVLASGCSAFSEDSGSASGGSGEATVAASFYPLAWLTEQVAEGTGTKVELLTQPGTEPHDLELDVRKTAEIAQADLVVYQAGFQPAVDDAVAQNAQGDTLDVAALADLRPVEESAAEHEEHGEEGHEEEGHEEEGHDHDHGSLDPHFWQDPLRVAAVADAVAGELASLDEDNADAYEKNAAALRTKLEALDASYTAGLADCARDTIVVSHDAFGYLAKYGLHLASIVGLSPDAEPTAAALGKLQELVKEEGITTVFSEPLKPALGKGLAADLGLTNGVLDPIEGLSDATSGEDYLSLMQANLKALQTANGCR